MSIQNTEAQFKAVMTECRELFSKKLHDYGASWRILRPSSLTDQLFIKAKRIRSLEIKKESLVGEGIRPEFIALRSEEHTSELQSRQYLVCRLLLEKKKTTRRYRHEYYLR